MTTIKDTNDQHTETDQKDNDTITNNISEESGVNFGPGVRFSAIARSLDELIDIADVIALGTIGELLATEPEPLIRDAVEDPEDPDDIERCPTFDECFLQPTN